MNTVYGMKGTIEKTIELDLERTGIQHRLCARQGDALVRRIIVRLMQGGKRYSPAGVVLARFYGLLSDGSTVSADGKLRADGTVEFVPGCGFFSVGGSVIIRFVLRGDDGAELYSPAFAIDTEHCFAADAPAVPAEEYSAIEDMLLRTLEAQRSCETAAEEIRNGDYTTPLSDAEPFMDGMAQPGISKYAARADHTHPTDTSRMPAINLVSTVANVSNTDLIPVYTTGDKTMKKMVFGRLSALIRDSLPKETWTFTLKDGTVVEKEVMVR